MSGDWAAPQLRAQKLGRRWLLLADAAVDAGDADRARMCLEEWKGVWALPGLDVVGNWTHERKYNGLPEHVGPCHQWHSPEATCVLSIQERLRALVAGQELPEKPASEKVMVGEIQTPGAPEQRAQVEPWVAEGYDYFDVEEPEWDEWEEG